MSLKNKVALVQYDTSVISLEELIARINDLGFISSCSTGNSSLQVSVLRFHPQYKCPDTSRITTSLLKMPGVADARVLVDTVNVVHDNAIVSANTLVDIMSNEGIPVLIDERTLRPLNASMTRIRIEGMTCHSCVRNIESVLSTTHGVRSVKVSLEKQEGVIEYDPSVTVPETLRDIIDDMGFVASLPNDDNRGARDMISTTNLRIRGMTCQSCVRNIESTVSVEKGIVDVKVFLESESATIRFRPQETAITNIVQRIEDMGFECYVMGQLDSSTNGLVRSVTLKLDGLPEEHDGLAIEKALLQVAGVESVFLLRELQQVIISYLPSAVDVPSLQRVITGQGFSSVCLSSGQ